MLQCDVLGCAVVCCSVVWSGVVWCTVVRCGESAALCVDQLPLLRRTAALPAAARCRASAAACCTPDLAAHGCVTAPADSISAAVGLATSCRTTSSRSSSCACGHSRAAVRAASLRPLRPAALRIVVLPVNGLRVVIHKSVTCNKSLVLMLHFDEWLCVWAGQSRQNAWEREEWKNGQSRLGERIQVYTGRAFF